MKCVWTTEEAHDAINHALQKSENDIAFSRMALEKPYEALQQITAQDVSPGFCLHMIESRPEYDKALRFPDFKKYKGDGEIPDDLTGRVSWNLNF